MADSESKKPSKRRLKAPSSTVREQAVKAQAEADKPARGRKLRAESTKKEPGRVAKFFDRKAFRAIGRVLLPRFVRGMFAELKLVTWPNRRETIRLTFAVIVFAIIFGVTITIVDYGLDKLFKALIIQD